METGVCGLLPHCALGARAHVGQLPFLVVLQPWIAEASGSSEPRLRYASTREGSPGSRC
jgi:hypothetical protein